jgi:hypothetical protein
VIEAVYGITSTREAQMTLSFVRLFATFPCIVMLSVATLSSSARAQLITPRTIPIHQNQQFEIFPSDRAGMAGVSLALDDSVGDPFVNPAKTARAPAGLLQISPFVHSVTLGGGGGRTVPLSGFFSSGEWSGGLLFSLQQLDRSPQTFNAPLSERHATNEYLVGTAARRLGGGIAIGASAYWSDLGGVDGVDRLYAGSDHLTESGHQADLRLGVTKDWGHDRTFELLVLRDRFDMTHDVHYPAIYYRYPVIYYPDSVYPPPNITPAHNEQNVDRTGVWGIHSEYAMPVGTHGWRVGWLATANRLSHPRIPNYQISNLPYDPGYTNAFNVGVGIARLSHGTTLGIDLILEPMWSRTWAEAARDTMTAVDGVIRAGERTVDNQFHFANSLLRFGVSQDLPLTADSSSALGLQAGAGIYSIKYRLNQVNHVSYTARTQDESWMEWTPTVGVHFRARDVQVSYDFSLTCGPNCSGQQRVFYPPPVASSPGDGVIVAPSAPLTFDGGSVKTHRITFSFRMR